MRTLWIRSSVFAAGFVEPETYPDKISSDKIQPYLITFIVFLSRLVWYVNAAHVRWNSLIQSIVMNYRDERMIWERCGGLTCGLWLCADLGRGFRSRAGRVTQSVLNRGGFGFAFNLWGVFNTRIRLKNKKLLLETSPKYH